MIRIFAFSFLIGFILNQIDDLEDKYTHFKKKFNRENTLNYIHEERKLLTFKKNYLAIQKNNQKNSSFIKKCNKFCDFDEEDFKSLLMNETKIPKEKNIELEENNENLRYLQTASAFSYKTIDWKYLFTEPKEQKRCDCCWSFTMVGAVEGNFAKKYGAKQRFSEQQTIDCTPSFGCDGGWIDYSDPNSVKSFI